MENPHSINIEQLWDDILSRQAELVRSAIGRLSEEERDAVTNHLQRMAEGPGWHPEQRASAQAALEALQVRKD